jgi:uncharacterized protein YfbU (UPF0304 family)
MSTCLQKYVGGFFYNNLPRSLHELKTTDGYFIIRAMMMVKAVHTSETSVYFKETIWHYIPEGYHLHTRRRENMKSHTQQII